MPTMMKHTFSSHYVLVLFLLTNASKRSFKLLHGLKEGTASSLAAPMRRFCAKLPNGLKKHKAACDDSRAARHHKRRSSCRRLMGEARERELHLNFREGSTSWTSLRRLRSCADLFLFYSCSVEPSRAQLSSRPCRLRPICRHLCQMSTG